jgi:hypothetical protein
MQVERCFVHIDYQHRDDDDHDLHTPVVRQQSVKPVPCIS